MSALVFKNLYKCFYPYTAYAKNKIIRCITAFNASTDGIVSKKTKIFNEVK